MNKILVGNISLNLRKKIGKGGEGTIYSLDNRTDEVVKIYHVELRESRRKKIEVMVSKQIAKNTSLIAFPKEIVKDHQGNFLGFSMKLVKGFRPIHELYNPKSRQQHFPKIDYRFIINTALNVVRAIGTVHQNNCIIGDLNHSGILVSNNSTVAIIDADSFQIKDKGITYPCVVGVPEFTPPELQGKNLKSVTRLEHHDYFGLSVAIFQLLFMGKHPYAGIFKQKDLSMTEAIQQNRFAFSRLRKKMTMTTPPPGSLTLDSFDGRLATAFENAFGVNPTIRPNPSDWLSILTSSSKRFQRCSRVHTHYYLPNSNGCFWCGLQGMLNFDYFPASFDRSTVKNINWTNIQTHISFIQSHTIPDLSKILRMPKVTSTEGSDLYKKNSKTLRMKKIVFSTLLIGSIGLFFLLPELWILSVFVGGFAVHKLGNSEIDESIFTDEYDRLGRNVQREINQLVKLKNLQELIKVRVDLDHMIKDFNEQDIVCKKLIDDLRKNRQSRKLFEFLDTRYIKDAYIPHIGEDKKRKLIYAGIETAADVNEDQIKTVSGFGPVLTSKVIAWRKMVESRFKYNSTVDATDKKFENHIWGFFSHNKNQLAVRIKSGSDQIRRSWKNLEDFKRSGVMNLKVQSELQRFVNIENDLMLLGIKSSKYEFKIFDNYVSNYLPLNRTPPNLPNFKTTLRTTKPKVRQTNTHGGNQKPPVTKNVVPKCPICSQQMKQRNGRYGQFWGCSNYPRCNGTRNI
jgi:DNA-binding helix-hairpin-helix protein with protein kinase domain